jgi:hypothetical protein
VIEKAGEGSFAANSRVVDYILTKELTPSNHPDTWLLLFTAHEQQFKTFSILTGDGSRLPLLRK